MPIMTPLGFTVTPPAIPETSAQPASIRRTLIPFFAVSRSPKKSTENIITYTGAIYISTTAVEIELACME